mgnify:FL=1
MNIIYAMLKRTAISFLFCVCLLPLGAAAPFAPLNNIGPENSLYSASIKNGAIACALYCEDGLDCSEPKAEAYFSRLSGAFKSWFSGVWNIIPEERKSEFFDLKPYLVSPKITKAGNTEDLLSKTGKNMSSISEMLGKSILASSAFDKDLKADLAVTIVKTETLKEICGSNALACYDAGFIYMPEDFKDKTLIHELGHAFGLADQYPAGLHNANPELCTSSIKKDSLMAAGAPDVTCDEADGVIFLFDCILMPRNPNKRHNGWKSICDRDLTIKHCLVE